MEKQRRLRYPHAAGAVFFEGLEPHEKEKSKGKILANHASIIAGETTFVKRMFVLEYMTTCIVQWP